MLVVMRHVSGTAAMRNTYFAVGHKVQMVCNVGHSPVGDKQAITGLGKERFGNM